ncbi:MAG: RNA polymerase sigma factor [Planctomycetota bacterium]
MDPTGGGWLQGFLALAHPEPSRRDSFPGSSHQPLAGLAGGKVAGFQGAGGSPSAGAQVERKAALSIEEVSDSALERARVLAEETGHELLRRVVSGRQGHEFQALNNALMDVFRVHQRVEAFSLLFELNTRPFSLIASRIMRMTGCRDDLQDILQDSFVAIYRYPSKFCPDKPNAFRNWSYSIIRNTVYRHLETAGREGVPVDVLTEVLADEQASSPADESAAAEDDARYQRVYQLLLCLYADIYERELKARDQIALRLVEVEHLGYREAADQLSIRLENFKMIVCRARKRIFQSLVRVLGTRKP